MATPQADPQAKSAGQQAAQGADTGTGPGERRAARRFTLIIHSAKLIAPEGEFLCVVRDISASGLKLKLFHPLPPGRPLALELANGDRFAIDPAWERDCHAGFRFAAPVDVPVFIHEPSPFRRRALRLRLHRPALLRAQGVVSPAALCDLSRQGARIESTALLARQQLVRLEAEGLPMRHAKVCWRNGAAYGLVFEETFQLDELARLAWQVQAAPPAAATAPVSALATTPVRRRIPAGR